MKKSKLVALALSLVMLFTLAACGGGGTTASTSPAPSTSTAPAESSAPADDGQVYELKLSSSQVTGSWLADLFDQYAANIEEATNGRVQVTVFHDNSLGAPPDLWTMFTQGGLEILNMGCAQAGEFPVTDIVQTPFFLSTPDTAGELMWTLYEEGMLPEFSDNMHVLTFLPTDMQMFATVDKRIETIDDFSGLKMRAVSGQLIQVFDKLNASAVSITTTEVFMALSQKTINGGVSSPSAMAAFVWQDAINYLYDLPISTGMNYVGVNLDVWNSLPADLQATLDEVSMNFYETYMTENNRMQQECIDTMAAAGVEVVTLSDETAADIKDAASTMLDELAESLNGKGLDGTGIIARAREIVAASQYEQ